MKHVLQHCLVCLKCSLQLLLAPNWGGHWLAIGSTHGGGWLHRNASPRYFFVRAAWCRCSLVPSGLEGIYCPAIRSV